MRLTTSLLVLLLALAAAGCGSAEGEPSADPDQPVQAPAQHDAVKAVDPAVCERLSRRLVGRPLDDARSMVREARCALRVVSQDGHDFPITEDFSPSRINVRVASGKVTEVTGLS